MSSINSLIESILADFEVNKVKIPVNFLFYEGHGDPYITYAQMTADGSFAGDDELLGYVDYWDFDVYSKGNYLEIVESLKAILESHDFRFQPSRTSGDLFEPDTGYFHKTLNFAILKEV